MLQLSSVIVKQLPPLSLSQQRLWVTQVVVNRGIDKHCPLLYSFCGQKSVSMRVRKETRDRLHSFKNPPLCSYPASSNVRLGH
jgi:hypothetical protein